MSNPSDAAPRKDVRAIGHQLDRLARAQAAPWLHQEVARRMAERLTVIRQRPATWLDWWGFLGGGASAVAAVWPEAQRWVAEPTPTLLARSRDAVRAPWWARVRRDGPRNRVVAVGAVADASAGMVWANMMLHWAAHEEDTIARWQRALAPGGFLMFSTFGTMTLRALHEAYAAAGWPAPQAPWVDMHDLGDLLVQGGFADPVMSQETLTLTWSSPGAALAELRAIGGNVAPGRSAGLRTPRWRRQLEAALAQHAGRDGRIALDFEIVYGHAVKPAAGSDRGGEAGSMRRPLRVSRTRNRGE